MITTVDNVELLVSFVKENNENEVKNLLNKDQSLVNKSTKNYEIALHTSARNNNVNIANILFASGALYNLKNSFGFTPMQFAIISKSYGMIERLREYGPCEAEDLLEAAYRLDIKALELLIKEKSDLKLTDEKGRNALHKVISIEDKAEKVEEVCKWLIQKGVNVNEAEKKDGAAPLHFVYATGNKRIIQLLEDNGADQKLKDKFNFTVDDWAKYADMAKLAKLDRKVSPHDYILIENKIKKDKEEFEKVIKNLDNLTNVVKKIAIGINIVVSLENFFRCICCCKKRKTLKEEFAELEKTIKK